MLLLNGKSFRGYADKQNRITPTSISAARADLASVRFLCEQLQRDFPNRQLKSLNLLEIQLIVRQFMFYGTNGTLGRSALNVFCAILNESYKLYNNGRLNDGIKFFIDKKLKRDTMAPILDELGLEYSEWYKGGSYGSIAMICSSVMLNEAIAILESDDTKIAQSVFKTFRQYPKSPTKWFENGTNSYDILTKYHEWRHFGLPARYDSLTIERFSYLAQEIRNHGIEVPPKLPWKNLREFGDYCELTMKAGLTTFLLLSGFRISELEPIDVNDYYKKPDGSWWFNTENPKTESGAVIGRSLHGLVAKAADIMVSLSALDAEKHNIPLFHAGFRGHAYDAALGWGGWTIERWMHEARYSKVTLSYWFKQFYETHVLPKNPDLAEIQKSVHPHQARHSFSEFTLRRFDQNVSAHLREHFRHSAGSLNFRRYTDEKLHESVQHYMELDYLEEIIHRIAANKIEDRLHGPAANKVKNDIAKFLMLTPSELNIHIRDNASNYSRFTAFEWGFCVLPKNNNRAKCIDSETNLPKVDVHSAPEICSGCPHHMYNEQQRNYLERIKIAHENIAMMHPLEFSKKMSAEVLRIIDRRLRSK